MLEGPFNFPFMQFSKITRALFHSRGIRRALTAASIACVLSACAATVDLSSDHSPKKAQSAAGADSKHKAVSQAAQLAKAAKAQKQARELALARLELQVTESEVQATLADHKHELAQAEFVLQEAQVALQRFQSVTRVHKLDEALLEVDRAQTQAKESEQELAQMQAMYTAETNLDATGRQTRDLVLERHQRQLEFAKRELALHQRAKLDLEQGELALAERKLNQALLRAQTARLKASADSERAQIETRIQLESARGKIADLESGLEVAAAKEKEPKSKPAGAEKSKAKGEDGDGAADGDDAQEESDEEEEDQAAGARG